MITELFNVIGIAFDGCMFVITFKQQDDAELAELYVDPSMLIMVSTTNDSNNDDVVVTVQTR